MYIHEDYGCYSNEIGTYLRWLQTLYIIFHKIQILTMVELAQ